MAVKISYHDYVKVKLTNNGSRIFKLIYGHEPRIDENGFYEAPLWLLMNIFGPYIKEHPDIFEERCLYVDEGADEKLQLNNVGIAQSFKDDFDNFTPSWYIYTDENGIPHSRVFDGDVESNQFFTDVSYRIAFGDCSGETMHKIYFKGKEVNYVGWQPCMKYEYEYPDGKKAWAGVFEHWDH